MNPPINLVIDSQELLTLGKQLGLQLSLLSPFRLADELAADSDAARRQPSTELVTGDGTLRPELIPYFQTLAYTESLGACAYIGSGALLDVSVYYPPESMVLPTVSLSLADEGVKLQSPPVFDGLLDWMDQYIGDSLVRAVDIDLEIPIENVWVLFGVVDAGRRQALSNMIGVNEASLESISIADISASLTKELIDLQWLAPHFADSLSLPMISESEIQKGLQWLAMKGYLSLSNDQVLLSDLVLEMISEFLIIDGRLRLKSACPGPQSKLNITELRGIQGRNNAMLLWSHDDRSVNLMGVSPAQTMAIISNILEAPASLLAGVGVSEAIEESILACPNCGAQIPSTKRFCTNCGQKL
jgi:hypothetical protein